LSRTATNSPGHRWSSVQQALVIMCAPGEFDSRRLHHFFGFASKIAWLHPGWQSRVMMTAIASEIEVARPATSPHCGTCRRSGSCRTRCDRERASRGVDARAWIRRRGRSRTSKTTYVSTRRRRTSSRRQVPSPRVAPTSAARARPSSR
jgi:hypothetical protein